jgi:triacylglycerol lipase
MLVLFALFGWLLTAAAVSLGAPFWFDLLQKVVQIRSSAKPAETAPAAVSGTAAATGAPGVAEVPRARALVRATAAAAPALETLMHFESARFGFSPVNFFWSARLAELAYVVEPDLVRSQLAEWSAQGELLSAADTQCVVACTPKAAFVVFRGTEQNLDDWMTDALVQLQAPRWDNRAGYQVHEGFNTALDAIWRDLDAKLAALEVYQRGLPIWLGGHSLGGALAAMAALRLAHHLKANNHRNVIACLHTVGQPRIGNPACAAALDQLLPARYFRSVNNRDVVPRVPLPSTPDLLGKIRAARSPLQVYDYAHAGRVIYFTDTGRAMMDPPMWYRGLDTLAAGLTKDQIKIALQQTVLDHNVGNYVRLHRAMLDVASGGAEG